MSTNIISQIIDQFPCCLSLQKLYNSRLEKFIDKHQIINEGQYGFRTKRTTSMAIIEATEEITNALDRKEHTVSIFMDLKKRLTL